MEVASEIQYRRGSVDVLALESIGTSLSIVCRVDWQLLLNQCWSKWPFSTPIAPRVLLWILKAMVSTG